MPPQPEIHFERAIVSSRFKLGGASSRNSGDESACHADAVRTKIRDGIYVRRPRACRLCRGTNFRILADHDRYGFEINTSICVDCGLIQTNPDLRKADYIDFYKNHYRSLYIADLVGSPEMFFKEEYWRGQKIYRFVRKHVAFAHRPLVLEVGCGAAGILKAFADRGFDVIGTDYGAENLAYGRARGIDIREGDVFSLTLDRKPDLVIYSHVLEHVYDPNEELQKIQELLAPGGYLYVEVPGIFATRTNAFQGDFLRMFHLAHIYNFTKSTLTRLVENNGFELIGGNEEVRAVFKRGSGTSNAVEGADTIYRYISTTERWRWLYRNMYQFKSALRHYRDQARAFAISLLKRARIYTWLREKLD